MNKKLYKSYKIRLYPTKEQEILFRKHIGCSRFIYNYFLDYQNKNYENGNKYVGKYDIQRLLSPLKKQEEFSFLNEVSSATL